MSVIKTKILIVDDEPSISRFIRHSLEAHHYKAVIAETGKEGVQKAIEERPSLIILDYGLPDMSGIEILKRIREWSRVPVIFLTVRDSEQDKVTALDGGADDYLTKPFGVSELLARIRLAFRHSSPMVPDNVIRSGAFEIDRAGHVVRIAGKSIKLTATEYTLLLVLSEQYGKIVSHKTILNKVWGPNSLEHKHYLRVYFGQIRRKFEEAFPGSGAMIQNDSGIGYRLTAN